MLGKLVVGAGFFYLGAKLLQPWFNTWGATKEEHRTHGPGEAALPNPKIASTHAITVDAQPADIWPWLVQMGVGRGGFYSQCYFGQEVQIFNFGFRK